MLIVEMSFEKSDTIEEQSENKNNADTAEVPLEENTANCEEVDSDGKTETNGILGEHFSGVALEELDESMRNGDPFADASEEVLINGKVECAEIGVGNGKLVLKHDEADNSSTPKHYNGMLTYSSRARHTLPDEAGESPELQAPAQKNMNTKTPKVNRGNGKSIDEIIVDNVQKGTKYNRASSSDEALKNAPSSTAERSKKNKEDNNAKDAVSNDITDKSSTHPSLEVAKQLPSHSQGEKVSGKTADAVKPQMIKYQITNQ
ncbi:hypothetical protein ACTXT7_005303 [Hymenolepis weldensis]